MGSFLRALIAILLMNQIFMWVYKEYDDKSAVGKTGEWSHLIHESLLGDDNRFFEGKWFYKDFESSS